MIPVALIIIIAMAVLLVRKRLPNKSTATNEATAHYENQGFRGIHMQNQNGQSIVEGAYDHIDASDVDMSASVYDMVDTDRVEYETVE